MPIANVVAHESRHRAEGARMRMGFKQWAIKRQFARIQAQAGPRLFQSVTQIIFVSNKVEFSGLRLIREAHVNELVEWTLLPRSTALSRCISVRLPLVWCTDTRHAIP